MVYDRAKAILEASVEGFIRTGKPITSEFLYETNDFGIKPAMIRWELNELSDEGYFLQTHPSGGRYPTLKAYRFFVDALRDEIEDLQKGQQKRIAESCYRAFQKGSKENFIKEIAEHINACGIGYDCAHGRVYESGLSELLEHVDFQTKDELIEVVEDVERVSTHLQEIAEWHEKTWPKVFIGKSPFTKSEHISLMVGKVTSGDDAFIFVGVSPLRTDYERTLSLFQSLVDFT